VAVAVAVAVAVRDTATGVAAGISEREADSLAGTMPVAEGVTGADDPAGLDSTEGIPAEGPAAVVDCPAVAAARVTSAPVETDEAAVSARSAAARAARAAWAVSSAAPAAGVEANVVGVAVDRVVASGSVDEVRSVSGVELADRRTAETWAASAAGSVPAAGWTDVAAAAASVLCGSGVVTAAASDGAATIGAGRFAAAAPGPVEAGSASAAGADALAAAGVVATAGESGTADDKVGAAAVEPAAEVAADADTPPIDPTESTADAAPVSAAPAWETSELLLDAGCACRAADIAPAIVPPEVWLVVWLVVWSAAAAPSSAPRRDRRESVFDLAAFADPFVAAAAAAGGLIPRTEPASFPCDGAADGAAGRQIVEVAAESR
jgi:hypothetical protein